MSAAVPHARPAGRLRKRLQSPIALVVEGFLLGTLIFFFFHPLAETAPVPSAGGASLLSSLQA